METWRYALMPLVLEMLQSFAPILRVVPKAA